MCMGCYMEYGSPRAFCDLTDYVIDLIGKVYEQPYGGAGGGMHIVVDDFNLEDSSIHTCLSSPEVTPVEKELGAALLKMTEDQRATALALYDGMIVKDGDE